MLPPKWFWFWFWFWLSSNSPHRSKVTGPLGNVLRLWNKLDYSPAPSITPVPPTEKNCYAVLVHMEAWFRVVDIYLTRVMALCIPIESGATIWSSIECEPMPSWPVVEFAMLWWGRQSLIVEEGGYWLWRVMHYSLQLFIWIPIVVLKLKVFSLVIMQMHVVPLLVPPWPSWSLSGSTSSWPRASRDVLLS